MKKRQIVLLLISAMTVGAIGGMLLSPAPVGAVAKEITELLTGVTILQQGQRDMQSSIDTKFSELRTLVAQQSDNSNKLNTAIGALQKTMQDLQANTGAQLSSMGTQVQGVTDNVSETQTRLSKINTQLVEVQNTLQTLDGKVTALAQPAPSTANPAPGSAPNPASGSTATAPPPAPQTLYDSARQDFLTGKYELALQEFQDYLKYYPTTDLASNSVFYQGEIAFKQHRYEDAVGFYSDVLSHYPNSNKLSVSLYQRGLSYIQMGKKASGEADLRSVIRLYPNMDEAPLARTKLHEMGVPVSGGGR
ncbi:MAG: tetratricopeptide repeat protein [Candidatus Acidiferrales bacterium]